MFENSSSERVKIFPQKNFALEVGLGREELQGIEFRQFATNFIFVVFVGSDFKT